jgi:hypothetical protein
LSGALERDRTLGAVGRHFGLTGLLGSLAAIVTTVALSGCGGSVRVPAREVFFRPVECTIPAFSAAHPPAAGPTTSSPSAASEAACRSANANSVPSTPLTAESSTATVILPSFYNSNRFVLGPADLDTSAIARASVITGRGSGYQVQVDLTAAGADAYNRIANERHPDRGQNGSQPGTGSEEAFEMNGFVVSTPAFEAPSSNGIVVIAGPATAPFSKKQAQGLAGMIERILTSA